MHDSVDKVTQTILGTRELHEWEILWLTVDLYDEYCLDIRVKISLRICYFAVLAQYGQSAVTKDGRRHQDMFSRLRVDSYILNASGRSIS